MQTMISSFQETAKQLEAKLLQIAQQLRQGYAPEIEDMECADLMADQMRTLYRRMTEKVFGTSPAESDAKYSAEELARIWEERTARLQQQQARSVLERFLRVDADDEGFVQALLPFREQAAGILAASDEKMPISVEPYAVFLQAMDLSEDELDGAVGESMLEFLDSNAFPAKVQRGLMRRVYREMPVDIASDVSAEAPAQPEPAAEPAAAEVAAPEPEAAPSAPVQSEAPAEPCLSPCYPFKNQSSAKRCVSDMEKIPGAFSLLSLLLRCGALTVSQLTGWYDVLNFPASVAEPDLERLARMGYVNACELDGEKLWWPTPAMNTLLAKSLLREAFFRMSALHHFSLSGKDSRPFDEGASGNPKRLRGLYRQNERLLAYARRIRKNKVDFFNFSCSFFEYLTWDGTNYHNSLVECTLLCRLSGPEEASLAAPGEAVLWVCDQLPDDASAAGCAGELYVYADQSYRWDNGWQPAAQKPAPEEAAAPNERPAEPEAPSAGKDTHPVKASADPAPRKAPEEAAAPPSPDPEVPQAPEKTPDATAQTAAEMADRLLKRCTGGKVPLDEELEALIQRLSEQNERQLNPELPLRDSLTEAAMLAFTAGMDPRYPRCGRLYQQLNTALETGLSRPERGDEALSRLFFQQKGGRWAGEQALALGACFQALLFPDKERDYGLKGLAESAFRDYEKHFPAFQYNELKELFHELLEGPVKNLAGGFTISVLRSMMGEEERAEQMERNRKTALAVQDEGKDAFSAVLKSLPRVTGLPEMYKACFGHNSDLYAGLEAVIANRTDDREMVEMVLEEYGDSEKLNRYIDEHWKKSRQAMGGSLMRLDYTARDKVCSAFTRRMEIMRQWLELTEDGGDGQTVRRAWNQVVSRVEACRQALAAHPAPGSVVMDAALACILDHLKGKKPVNRFAVLLDSGWFTLDQNGLPILGKGLQRVRYAEPWCWMLEHLRAPRRPLKLVCKEIFDRDSALFDNLGQLAAIRRFLGQAEIEEDLQAAERFAAQARNKLQDKLELAYTYDRIGNGDKERILGLLERYQPFFYDNHDFAAWRRFLSALERQIDDADQQGYERLLDRLSQCASPSSDRQKQMLDTARTYLERDRNFAVAEEYINRFERGDEDLPLADQYGADYYADFLRFAPDCYSKCQRNQHTSSSLGKGWGWTDVVRPSLPRNWSSNNQTKSETMLRNWITAKGSDAPSRIGALAEALGFHVTKQESAPLPDKPRRDGSCALFRLEVTSSPKNSSDGFAHPIAAFGTRMASALPVLCVYGGKTSRQLVDLACSCNLGEPFLLLANYPLSDQTRREIGEYFHTEKNANQKPFLVVDQVLFLFLATLEENQRLPALLQCTLPYTIYQPFNGENGSTPDEMFCGRVQELARIRDGSAKLVYGGRQLGKTALLQRTASLKHDPKNKSFALFVDILDFPTEQKVLEKIVTRAREQQIPLEPCDSFTGLCDQIRRQLNSGEINEFHLLIDEADRFMEAISGQRYQPLKPLVELNRENPRFKFTLAGLHNVRRAFRSVDDPNSIFGQMGQPLCVRPLSPADALKLLTRPLHYLGFRFSETTHIETILTKTNYYPGILQFSGYTLASTLATHYRTYYTSQSNPPFPLTREQLASIINDTKLNPVIKEKILLTLQLDPRYHMLARCIAVLCHLDLEENGFSLEQIRQAAENFCSIRCLSGLTDEEYRALLDELVDMGILLHQTERDSYSFLRRSFLEVIGPDLDKLYEEIERANQKGGETA